MPRKPIELPPAVARRFVEDMLAFFAEKNASSAMSRGKQRVERFC